VLEASEFPAVRATGDQAKPEGTSPGAVRG
jgi:hypothetical protein